MTTPWSLSRPTCPSCPTPAPIITEPLPRDPAPAARRECAGRLQPVRRPEHGGRSQGSGPPWSPAAPDECGCEAPQALPPSAQLGVPGRLFRSEERRVGKGWRDGAERGPEKG